jgi:diguanylate cyclase (GGDEF)-like protein
MLRSAAFLFANAFIRAEVDYDALTGIHNRRFFDENMKRVISSLSRSESLLSMLMIDIDFFKRYNDTYGHLEGDRSLKIVAEALSKSITRSDDFVVRYGGEEFAIVLPNTDEHGARLISEKLLNNIRKCNIPHEQNDAAACLTISIGATTGKVSHTHIPEDFVKRADEMLYKSKQNGRNQYFFEYL